MIWTPSPRPPRSEWLTNVMLREATAVMAVSPWRAQGPHLLSNMKRSRRLCSSLGVRPMGAPYRRGHRYGGARSRATTCCAGPRQPIARMQRARTRVLAPRAAGRGPKRGAMVGGARMGQAASPPRQTRRGGAARTPRAGRGQGRRGGCHAVATLAALFLQGELLHGCGHEGAHGRSWLFQVSLDGFAARSGVEVCSLVCLVGPSRLARGPLEIALGTASILTTSSVPRISAFTACSWSSITSPVLDSSPRR